MRRILGSAAVVGIALLATSCGGGGNGQGLQPAYLFGGVRVPDSGTRMKLSFQNLDTHGTTVSFQGYQMDGTAYSPPIFVDLDGLGRAEFVDDDALGGNPPAGGWIAVQTPSMRVMVVSAYGDDVDDPDEAAPAFKFPNVIPATFHVGVSINPETALIQLSNASAAPIVVDVTGYVEPVDPFDPPDAFTKPAVALNPKQTKVFSVLALTGFSNFFGSVQLESTDAFMALSWEGDDDIAIDVPQVEIESRVLEFAPSFGRENLGIREDFLDFSIVARNDTSHTTVVTLAEVAESDGTPLLSAPRSFTLAGFETRYVATIDALLSDIFGDVSLATGLVQRRMAVQVPDGVDVTLRQYDPELFFYAETLRGSTLGHQLMVADVLPQPFLPSSTENTLVLMNPGRSSIVVNVDAVVPEPNGFDSTRVPLLPSIIVPAGGLVRVSPDGQIFFNRDAEPVEKVGLFLSSISPFASVFGTKKRVAPNDLLVAITPHVVRNYDDGDN